MRKVKRLSIYPPQREQFRLLRTLDLDTNVRRFLHYMRKLKKAPDPKRFALRMRVKRRARGDWGKPGKGVAST